MNINIVEESFKPAENPLNLTQQQHHEFSTGIIFIVCTFICMIIVG